METITRRCVMLQCFAIGGWLMLLGVKFLLSFPLSSEIGTIAIYVTAILVLVAMGALSAWNRKFTLWHPEMTCLRNANEKLNYFYRVFAVICVLSTTILAITSILILGFRMKTTAYPIKRYLTNWQLYLLSLSWLGHLAFFVYDLITLHLWENMEEYEVSP